MSTKRASLLARQWQRGGWLSTALRPLSALTAWAVARKRERYASGAKVPYRAPVPVVVIGNIYVGGTGKTPMVIATVENLRARGYTPGVVSRGYGVKVGPHPRVGLGDLEAARFGDEPALIARATGAPVSIHPRRARAAQALLQAHPRVDVIVSDDGLQHLALARDIEIVVQDQRGVGNRRLLPAGPLREPASRLDDVDAVITNIGTAGGAVAVSDTGTVGGAAPVSDTGTVGGAAPVSDTLGAPPRHGGSLSRVSDTHLPSAPEKPESRPRQIQMWLEPGLTRHIAGHATRPLSAWVGQPRIAAAAGIGNPERFFATLRAAGITLSATLPLPDHHDYATSPFSALDADVILVTAKDAIKCDALNDPRLWEVPVQAAFSDPELFDWLADALRARKDRPNRGQTPAA